MRRLLFVALVLLVSLSLGCEELAQIQDEDTPVSTPMPPVTPELPKEAGESGVKPSPPRPADTPAPADTPKSATTPLAVLPSYTPEPTVTVVPRPTATPVSSESAQVQREEYVARCKHWALRNLKPVEYSRFEKLDPYDMTDLERVPWGSVIVEQDRVNHIDFYYSNSTDYGVFRFRRNHIEWC